MLHTDFPDRPSGLSYRPAVTCRNVTKSYDSGDAKVMALRGVDLDIPAGEMALLVGPSGCGKTTLISIVAGLLEPTGGEVTVLATPLHTLTPRQLVDFRRDHIGFVFQQYNLLPALTTAENVAVPLLIAGRPRKESLALAKEMLQQVGLGDKHSAQPAHLSGGQQQRVAIARALVSQPRLLVCDEPTAALDAKLGHSVMELIRKVAVQPDRCVIVVTHDSRVFDFGERIIRMSDGVVEGVEIQSARETESERSRETASELSRRS